MKTKGFLLIVALAVSLIISSYGFSEDNVYYARCNLKVIKGSLISWVNWQSTRKLIPVGTKLNVTKTGSKATLVEPDTGKSYILDIGDSRDMYLDKFVTKEKFDTEKLPEDIRRNILKAVAKVGMTKEHVYIAMGPPAWAGEKTNTMTYEGIMHEDLWTYKRKRFAKNIGVSFDPITGLVDRTEGIWGK